MKNQTNLPIFRALFAFAVIVAIVSCKKEQPVDEEQNAEPKSLAEVLTVSIDSTGSTWTVHGEVLYDGGSEVIERGFCWSTNPLPTLDDSVQVVGSGVGKFDLTIEIGQPDEVVYIRAFATNSIGISFGDVLYFQNDVAIGDYFEGGIVFYLFKPGDQGYVEGEAHGIIAAEEDIGKFRFNASVGWTSPEGGVALSWAIGDGMQNTLSVASNFNLMAGWQCRELELNGYDDWHLPSYHELWMLREVRYLIGGFEDDFYWSSSQYTSSDYAYGGNFDSSELDDDTFTKLYAANMYYVRPVRYF